MNTVSTFDRKITQLRRELCSLEQVDVRSAASWQAAWDRHPDLCQMEKDLFILRAIAQEERYAKEAKIFARASASAKRNQPKKCPQCGFRTLAA